MANTVADPDDAGAYSSACSSAADRSPAEQGATGSAAPEREQVDLAVFTQFYNTAVPKLVAFLRWQGAPLSDAADCVQEAMIEAYSRWSTIDHPYAWCRLVASRRYARRVATNREDLAENVEPAGVPLLGPEDVLAAMDERHAVLRALDLLPSRQRQVMAWTYDGAAPAEIAVALRITPEAVRATLYKARTALRAHLDIPGGEQR